MLATVSQHDQDDLLPPSVSVTATPVFHCLLAQRWGLESNLSLSVLVNFLYGEVACLLYSLKLE